MRSLRPALPPVAPRRLLLPAAAAVVAVVAGACERASRPPAAESTGVVTPAANPPTPVSPAVSGWPTTAGPVLLVAWPSADEGSVVLPNVQGVVNEDVAPVDTAALRRSGVLLLGRGGASWPGRITGFAEDSAEEACSPWPLVRVADAAGATPPWSVGFAGGTVAPIALDSLPMLSSRDSARLAAEATRLASIAPAPVESNFRGLPFFLSDLHRFSPAPGVAAFVAVLVRQVNQEASPREERTILVAERDSAQGAKSFTLGYYERASGAEETIVSPDVLAAVSVGPEHLPMLVLGRDYGETQSFALLERVGPGEWRVRWTSARMRC